MVGSTTIKLPFPIKIGRLYFYKHKNVTFNFDNLSLFLFMDAHKEMNGTFAGMKKYIEENKSVYFVEMLFYAHLSYHKKDYSIPTCSDFKSFAVGVSKATPEQVTQLSNCMKSADAFGVRKVPVNKKKVKAKS